MGSHTPITEFSNHNIFHNRYLIIWSKPRPRLFIESCRNLSILERIVSCVRTSDGRRWPELHLRLVYVLRETIWWSPTATLSRYTRDRYMVVVVMMMITCLFFTCIRHIIIPRRCPYLQLRFLYIVGEPLVCFQRRLYSSDQRLLLLDVCYGFGCLRELHADSLCLVVVVVRWRFSGNAANGSDRTRHCSEDLLTHSASFLLLLVLAATLWVLCHRLLQRA